MDGDTEADGRLEGSLLETGEGMALGPFDGDELGIADMEGTIEGEVVGHVPHVFVSVNSNVPPDAFARPSSVTM